MKNTTKTIILSILFCLIGTKCTFAQQASSTNFYFAQITDTHLGNKEHYRRTKTAIDEINNLPMQIEFVAHTGDITADETENFVVVTNTIALFNQLKMPVYYTPGNHDIHNDNYDVTMAIYTNHFGKLIESHEYNGVVFIFVYTQPLARTFIVDFNPFKELERELKLANGKPVIIFHHQPSTESFYKNKMHSGWREDINNVWVKLVNKYNVKAIIAGHLHNDEHNWVGEVPLYVCPSIAGYWDRQGAYRIYEYKDGKISYRTMNVK
jgi:predicted MPP superfamily phosphohydrolase